MRRRPGQLASGRHGLTAEEVRASQRKRILDAMVGTVGEHGYHGVRVAEVVWRAGVSRKTFYELFAGKDECFAAAYEEQLDRLLSTAFDAFETQDEWVDRLRAAVTAMLGALSRDPATARLCFVEAMSAGAQATRLRDEQMDRLGALFEIPGTPDGPLSDALRAGRVGEISEVLRREIAAGRATQLPARVPELMFALTLPLLGPDVARGELERGGGATS